MSAADVSLLDRAIATIAPRWALSRVRARRAMAYYEAARPNRQRRQRRDASAANVSVRAAGATLRAMARHLEQNNPHARGLLRVLVNNAVGPNGIGIEPSPRMRDGSIHDAFARQLAERFERWSARPEVTRRMSRGECERMLMRSVLRDGEALVRHVEGTGPRYRHSTATPYSLQLLEADHLPIGYDSTYTIPGEPAQSWPIWDGLELNGWGEVRAYHIHSQHPGEQGSLRGLTNADMRRVPAEQMTHIALCDRLHQRRGVSLFPSVLETFDDLADYEESERVAAKVAASLAAAIVKGDPGMYGADTVAPINDDDADPAAARELSFRAGMIFDDLRPGERVEMIGNNGRPNPALVDFRFAMLRAIAAATGASFSSIAKKYGETYSGQRQELVESWVDYAVLSSLLISGHVRPVWQRFVAAELLAGNLLLPSDVDPASVSDALFIPPSMPWIDPAKEAAAWEKLEQAGHASGPEIIRRRGQSPAAVRDAEIAWRKSWRAAGEQITADPASEDITTVPDAPSMPNEEAA